MTMTDWTADPEGQIESCPLLGYETARFHTVGMLRLIFARSEHQLRRGDHESLQLAASPGPLRELAVALMRLADQIEASEPGTRQ